MTDMTDANERWFIVATTKPWNLKEFHVRSPRLAGRWHLVTDHAQLNLDLLAELKPRYVFFPHWSWRVPIEVLEAVECVCFHMADVPYGRGGSPLQNLILRGHRETKMSALRMVSELDAGPVYLKVPMDLSGRAQEIFERAAIIVFDMIEEIVRSEPVPVPQQGKATIFSRRTPEMSSVPESCAIHQLYDHIRMLDALTYPPAFIRHGGFRFEFHDAVLQDDETLTARVTISKVADE